MLGQITRVVLGGAAAAVGASVGKKAVRDIRERYKRAKLRKELRAARGEEGKTSDELAELKRKLNEK